MAARWQVFFPCWVPSGLTSLTQAVAAIADDRDIFCLLIWQAIFHLSNHSSLKRGCLGELPWGPPHSRAALLGTRVDAIGLTYMVGYFLLI